MVSIIPLERSVSLIIACFETLIHGGVIFGWPSLVFTLKQIGYFSAGCQSITNTSDSLSINDNTTEVTGFDNSPSSCPGQDAQLQLVFSISSAVQPLCMFPVGVLFDKLGIWITRITLSVLMLVGYLLIAFSSPDLPAFLFPGTILITVGGVMLLLSNMEMGNLFVSHKSTVITFFNGSYSASVCVFLVIKIAYEVGFSINTSFFILAASTVFLNVNTFTFLPFRHIPWPPPKDYRLLKCRKDITDDKSLSSSSSPKGDDKLPSHNLGYVEDADQRDQNGTKTGDIEIAVVTAKRGSKGLTNHRQSVMLEDRKRIEYNSVLSCIKSKAFWLILIWQMILQLDMTFTFGTLNNFLTRLADKDANIVSWYTNVFSIIQLLVIVLGPVGGLLMDRNKRGFPCCPKGYKSRGLYADLRDSCLPLALTSLASIAYSICFLIPNLPLQYLSFTFFLILRSMLFGVGAAVTALVFPKQYFGSVYGAIRTIGGICLFIQYPLFILIQNVLDGDPFYVTIGFVVADAMTFLLPAYLYISSKRKDAEESELTSPSSN